MKILSSEQIRQADKYTIAHEPVSSLALMERAATACVKWIAGKFDRSKIFNLICGTGNNGGDGFLIASLLHEAGFTVKAFVIEGEKQSADFKTISTTINTRKNILISEINSSTDFPIFNSDEIIIDCIFGTGLNKPVSDIYKSGITSINQSGCTVISVDMPSGMFCDSTSKGNVIVRADYTLTFQTLKPAFLFAENAEFFGEVSILNIGLNDKFIHSLIPFGELTEENFIREIIKPRKPFSHKGSYGHAAIIAGSFGKTGAAVLATRACMRSGAGLTTAIIPKSSYEIMQTAAPEAMAICSEAENYISGKVAVNKFTAVGCGPGIGTEKETATFLKLLIQEVKCPLVLDADALNILSENKTWLKFLPAHTILTPHPKEFERLAGKAENDFERNRIQRDFSKKYNVVVILKGKYSCITAPEGKTFFNPTGNPGMAKGGSGDVLLGIITSLLAQSYSPFESAVAGTYLHGFAGDFAEKEKGNYAMLATDMIENLGNAFNSITQNTLSSYQKNFSHPFPDSV